jgi:hypothetical protein
MRLGVLFSFWWHLWKERNRQIFENKECSVPQLASMFREEIYLLRLAFDPDYM